MGSGNAKKKILVTGGAGGVGAFVSRRFAKEGHTVRIFDLDTPANRSEFPGGESGIETFWGDITKPESIGAAVEGMDEMFHLAAIVPPYTEQNPAFAEKINVGGTRNVVDAVNAESARAGKKIPVRFSSSVTVYGITNEENPPIPADHPVNPCCNYSKSKVAAEEIVRASGQPWTIYRFSAAVYLDIRPGGFSQMRIIPPSNRIEFIHIFDIAEAFVNSLDNEETYEKTFVLAGGPGCQMTYKEQLQKTFRAMGFPEPNWKKFNNEPFNLDWYDTTESQRVLRFQNHNYDEYLEVFIERLGAKVFLFRYVAGPLMHLFRIHI